MENIFSLINVDVENNINSYNLAGNIIGYAQAANNNNLYSVGYGKNVTNGPTIYSIDSNTKYENIYYFADKIFNNSYNQKNTPLALWDKTFQNQILNSENAFNVEELVEQGYYPQLKWPNCMPKQVYIKLPKVEDKDLADILSTEILESTNNSAKVKFSVNNPSAETITNIKIKNLECKIESQEYKDGKSAVIAILSNPIICVSKYEVISISTKGAYNQEYTRKFKEKERIINISFYKDINTTEDWKNINKSLNENYILMQDLDFKNNPDDVNIWNQLNGIIDGNNHTVKNVKSKTASHIFWNRVNEIKNINFENISLENVASWGAIIHTAEKANNVHANNIKIINKKGNEFNTTHGGLFSLTIGEIKNCGINNITIISNAGYSAKTRIGGLIGVANSSVVENCFVTNVNIQSKNTKYEGVGGLIGASETKSTIKNCYTTGKIEIEGENVGGIAGYITNYGELLNNYSCVNISGNTYNIGGIVGIADVSTNIKNNISFGNLYTSRLNTEPGRVIGNGISSNTNYAYSNQRLNGIIKEEEGKVKILTAEELVNKNTYINLGYNEAFDYSELKNNILPKLYKVNEDGSYSNEILPYQDDAFLDISNELKIENINIEKTVVDQVAGQIIVKNTNEAEIIDLEIDGMNVELENIINKEGKTYINITAKPNKFYDAYKITKIKYKENGKQKEQDIEGKIQIQFFKELYNFEDWQSIESGTYQNYKLMKDIDFYGKKNINENVTMARLEAIDGNKALKNVYLEFDNENSGFINEISTNIANINFENINIINAKAGKKTGVIANLNGSMKNVNFDRITIEAPQMNCTGIIGIHGGNLIENINGRNIKVIGKDKTGGLIGNIITNTEINAVYVEGINVTGNDYTAGVIGYVHGNRTIESGKVGKIDIVNVEVTGNNNVGGFIGYNFFQLTGNSKDYVTIKDSTIIGKGNNVGGICGEGYNMKSSQAINIKVEGYGNNIGGINGISNQNGANIYDSYVFGKGENSSNVGGVFGVNEYGSSGNRAVHTKVSATGSNVGANIGLTKQDVNNVLAINCEVEGYSNIGGNIGKVESGICRYVYNNSNIKAYQNTAGGIIGYLENAKMVAGSNTISLYESYFAGGKVVAKANVGGVIGYIEKELYEPERFYYSNYVEADLTSEDANTTSLGIGNMPNQNQYLKDTYFYKYSSINGKNPDKQNEIFIEEDKYLKEEDLKNKETYVNKLKWNFNAWNYNVLKDGKYPTHATNYTIDLPKDSEHIIVASTTSENNKEIEKNSQNVEQTFEYNDKKIQTYSTYSVIEANDGSSVRRDGIKLYVKNGKLYAVPAILNSTANYQKFSKEEQNSSDYSKEVVTPVADNLILDNYNGKEYETVLGSDGRIYDLKEQLNYPENFVNKNIASIGNNLNDNLGEDSENSDNEKNLHKYEIEVVYKNGDTLRFNYQTGELINFSELENSSDIGVWEYIKEKTSEIGNFMGEDKNNKNMQNKYEESIKLQNKLEERPVEEAMEEQQEKDKLRKVNNKYIKDENTEEQNITTNKIKEEANNSLKEQKYISIYNTEKGEYQIYNEEELLDTSKQEVISENEKIEANNLKEYYASEGKAENTKMGIVWIALSIIGVVIILFAMKKR